MHPVRRPFPFAPECRADTMVRESRSGNPIPDSITGSEAANTVLLELRLGLVSRKFVENWIKELRGEGFDQLSDALEANL